VGGVHRQPRPEHPRPRGPGPGGPGKAGVALIVDNTFGMGGYLLRPLEWGAALVTHSLTKWVGGHGAVIAGALVDGGHFPWDNGRYPLLTEPQPGYHGLRLTEAFGELAFIVKARVDGLRDQGQALGPFEAWVVLLGMETLSLRAERHVENTLHLAHWLKEHPKVAWVNYPGLEDHPHHPRAEKYFRGKPGAVLTFGHKEGYEGAKRFISRLKLISHLANVGDTRTLAIHPRLHHPLPALPRGAGLGGGGPGDGAAQRGPGARGGPQGRARGGPGMSEITPRGLGGPRGAPPQAAPLPPLHPPAQAPHRRPLPQAGGVLHGAWRGFLPEVRLRFETYGGLSRRRDNAVLVFHALTGSAHLAGVVRGGHLPKPLPPGAGPSGSEGWWDSLVGPGRILDPSPLLRGLRQPPGKLLRLHRPPLPGPPARGSPTARTSRPSPSATWPGLRPGFWTTWGWSGPR
jgi:hypothetical protein